MGTKVRTSHAAPLDEPSPRRAIDVRVQNKLRPSRGVPLDEATRARLRRLIDECGVPETSRRMRLAVNVIIRGAGGFPILLGSAALIREGLSSMEARVG